MGGKRPDQHNIDYRDSSASDNKFIDDDRHIHEEEKQHLQSNPKDQPMIPETNVNPALRELRERKGQQATEDE
jgi:hypothetical protein